jgi:hypothetical protein
MVGTATGEEIEAERNRFGEVLVQTLRLLLSPLLHADEAVDSGYKPTTSALHRFALVETAIMLLEITLINTLLFALGVVAWKPFLSSLDQTASQMRYNGHSRISRRRPRNAVYTFASSDRGCAMTRMIYN